MHELDELSEYANIGRKVEIPRIGLEPYALPIADGDCGILDLDLVEAARVGEVGRPKRKFEQRSDASIGHARSTKARQLLQRKLEEKTDDADDSNVPLCVAAYANLFFRRILAGACPRSDRKLFSIRILHAVHVRFEVDAVLNNNSRIMLRRSWPTLGFRCKLT